MKKKPAPKTPKKKKKEVKAPRVESNFDLSDYLSKM